MAWGEKYPQRSSFLNATVLGDFGQDGELHCVTPVIIVAFLLTHTIPTAANRNSVMQASFLCRCGSGHGTLEPHRPRVQASKCCRFRYPTFLTVRALLSCLCYGKSMVLKFQMKMTLGCFDARPRRRQASRILTTSEPIQAISVG